LGETFVSDDTVAGFSDDRDVWFLSSSSTVRPGRRDVMAITTGFVWHRQMDGERRRRVRVELLSRGSASSGERFGCGSVRSGCAGLQVEAVTV